MRYAIFGLMFILLISVSSMNLHANTLVAQNTIFTPVNPEEGKIPGISQAIIIEKGRLMYLSGHIPIDQNGKIVGKDIETQMQQIFSNMEKTLKKASTNFSSLVRLTFYIRNYDVRMLDKIRKVRDKWINTKTPPASALIGVASLFHPDVLVEIDAVAVLPD